MIDDEIDSPMPENFTSTKKTFPEMGENGRSQDGQDGGEAIIDIFATSEKELALCGHQHFHLFFSFIALY